VSETQRQEPADVSAATSSNVRLERVRPDMFDEIYRELLLLLDPRKPVEEFRRIFEYPWRTDEDYVGFALFDGRQVAGFIGLIFSELVVENRPERFCNVTSLIAKKTHGAEAALLLFPLRTLREYTITNLTCNHTAYRLFSRLGFSVLDERRTILYPSRASFSSGRAAEWTVVHEAEEIRPHLGPEHQRILDHHIPYAEHLLVRRGERYCYIVLTLGRYRLFPSARIHFVSDQAVLAESWPTVQRSLWRRHRAVLAQCDSRLLRGVVLPGSRPTAMSIPRLYRSDRLRPEQIPNLYSELILLNLP
jgi:hypothetical protein